MSGGHFDYQQYRINDMAFAVDELIKSKNYSDNVVVEFKKGLDHLRKAAIYVQRIDWLVCCDDSEKSFFERLDEDLSALKDVTQPHNG